MSSNSQAKKPQSHALLELAIALGISQRTRTGGSVQGFPLELENEDFRYV